METEELAITLPVDVVEKLVGLACRAPWTSEKWDDIGLVEREIAQVKAMAGVEP